MSTGLTIRPDPGASAPLASTALAKPHIEALDGLRFLAAFFVAAAHYSAFLLTDPKQPNAFAEIILSMAGLGMTLFFVLSGFVIHYNYREIISEPGGFKIFAIARFSRLYPLYIVLFAVEFTLTARSSAGSCGYAGYPAGLAFALPYYVTLTQDWVFGVICKNSLIYQYGHVAAVSWSISAEAFFYFVYAVVVPWLTSQKPRALLAGAALAYACLFLFVWLCFVYSASIDRAALAAFGPVATDQNGYQDSLLRWLYYFNPLVQMVHFFGGVTAAQYYLVKSKQPNAPRTALSFWLAPISVALVLGAHLYLYGSVAYHNGFIGRNASSFYGPLVVVMIYLIARFHSDALSRILSFSIVVKLGEASYSLYLLHAFFHAAMPSYVHALALNRWIVWSMYLIFLLCVSRTSYVFFERPARRILRNALT